ncbi:MAG TPA: IBR domain-containing protein [Thermoguttaceae bacterium]
MPTISTCPRCSRFITIPEHLEAAALVACPFCGAEFPLGDAMALIPPELIPVKGTGSVCQNGPEGATHKPNLSPYLPFAFSPLALGAEGPEHDRAVEEIAAAEEDHFDAEVFAGITKQPVATGEKPPGRVEPQFNRRRVQRKPKSAVRIFIEIIIGGLVGITVAYVALAWIMGSRFDLPRPPKALQPVLRFVLPDRIWEEKTRSGD